MASEATFSQASRVMPPAGWFLADRVRQLGVVAFLLSTLGAAMLSPNPWLSAALFGIAGCVGIGAASELTVMLMGLRIMRRLQGLTLGPRDLGRVVPDAGIHGPEVKRLFAHPDLQALAGGQIRAQMLWWQAPAVEAHQQFVERTGIYPQLKSASAQLLKKPVTEIQALIRAHMDEAMERERAQAEPWAFVGMRKLLAPVVVGFCYEFVMGRKCSPEDLNVLVASTTDVIATIQGLSRRDMTVRMRALDLLRAQIESDGGRPDLFGEACTLTSHERAQYVLGVWLHTGSAQIVRMVGNAICHLSRNPRCWEQLARDDSYAEAIMLETLRIRSGTGITNRVATNDIEASDGTIPSGAVILFHVLAYHHSGHERAHEFLPERWYEELKKNANYMPFGLGARRCPAERLSLIVGQEILTGFLRSGMKAHAVSEHGILFARQEGYVTYDLCCLERRPSFGGLRRGAMRARLRAGMMLELIRRGLTQLSVNEANARDAAREFPDLLGRSAAGDLGMVRVAGDAWPKA